jgi:uncharacterized protein (TIGR00251 family)
MKLTVSQTPEGAKFAVRVAPRASRTAIVGVSGDGPDAALRIALQAPAIEGRANVALIEFLADLLGVRRGAIEITAGQHARNKVILVRGPSAAEIGAAVERELP